jgi:hypothetical protein
MTDESEPKGFFKDESGAWSMARVLLTISLALTFALVALDTFLPVDVPGEGYVLFGTIFTGLLAWTAGPRIAQYVGPQMGAVASGIAQAVQRQRLAGTDDRRKDDERG